VIVGCPKEVKNNENRVGLTPGGVWALSQAGHTVLIENSAGAGSHFSDDEYRGKGAEVVDSASEVWTRSETVVKVKEPPRRRGRVAGSCLARHPGIGLILQRARTRRSIIWCSPARFRPLSTRGGRFDTV